MIGALLGAVVALQPAAATLVARVMDAASGRPLPNAEIIDRVTGSRRFTNQDGEVRIQTRVRRETLIADCPKEQPDWPRKTPTK